VSPDLTDCVTGALGYTVPCHAQGMGYVCVCVCPDSNSCFPVPTGMGQLLVWEWQSESYVLKQQGHFNSMVALAYSPDGQYIVTGGDDGKVSTGHHRAELWVG
jgi:WD40 repeat protein